MGITRQQKYHLFFLFSAYEVIPNKVSILYPRLQPILELGVLCY